MLIDAGGDIESVGRAVVAAVRQRLGVRLVERLTQAGNGPPPPRANPNLLGHEAAERALRRLFRIRAHAACGADDRPARDRQGDAGLSFRPICAGLRRTGGASAGRPTDGDLLAVPPDCGVFRRVASGGHADLLAVERAYDPRRRRLRSEIVVDDTREIAAFLRLTAGGGRLAGRHRRRRRRDESQRRQRAAEDP